jgi:hypothetical protein
MTTSTSVLIGCSANYFELSRFIGSSALIDPGFKEEHTNSITLQAMKQIEDTC